MGRIRAIKPDFFRHVELYELEKETGLPVRLAFAGLFTVADRAGRFEWKPRVLKLDILPHDELDFARVLDALERAHFVHKYEAEGKLYGVIPTFLLHQIPNKRERQSQLPAPPVQFCALHVLARARQVNARAGQEPAPDAHVQDCGELEGEREHERENQSPPDGADSARARVQDPDHDQGHPPDDSDDGGGSSVGPKFECLWQSPEVVEFLQAGNTNLSMQRKWLERAKARNLDGIWVENRIKDAASHWEANPDSQHRYEYGRGIPLYVNRWLTRDFAEIDKRREGDGESSREEVPAEKTATAVGYGSAQPIPDDELDWVELSDGTRALAGRKPRARSDA